MSELIDLRCKLKHSQEIEKCFKMIFSDDGTPVIPPFEPNAVDTLVDNLTDNASDASILMACTKALRNVSISPKARDYLRSNTKLFTALNSILMHKQQDNALVKYVLQFVISLYVDDKAISDEQCEAQLGVQVLDLLRAKVCQHETLALLYVLTMRRRLQFDAYECVLSLKDCQSEYWDFLVQDFVKQEPFWQNYARFDIDNRILVLQVIHDQELQSNVCAAAWPDLVHHFNDSMHFILELTNSSSSDTDLRPLEVAYLVHVFASACAVECVLRILQTSADLMVNAAALLMNVHRLGKEGENCFTIKQGFDTGTVAIQKQPVYGLKANLVRIIGNLAWKCDKMQNLARDSEVIPVLLDCCNIDEQNPYIMQCVVFAIRNLCENNTDNQAIIAAMQKMGSVSSSLLDNLALTLHTDGENTIKIAPLPK